MIGSIFALIACSSNPGGLSDWARVDYVRAAGYERVAQGRPHPFTIIRSKDSFLYNFTRDIDGQLAGAFRTELGTPQGVFTWLAGDPRYVLKMRYASAPEFVESLLPVKFHKSEVLLNTTLLQQRLGKKLEREGEQEVASRDCLVLSFSDRTPLVKTLWVDEETGYSLKQQDTVANQVVYERTLSSFESLDRLSPGTLELPQESVVIKGLVSPQMLLWVNRAHPFQQYQSDLAAIQTETKVQGGSWIKQIIAPSNFEYMGSKHFENIADEIQPSIESQLAQAPSNEMVGFGGIPMGWSEAGQVVIHSGRLYYGFPSVPDTEPRGVFMDGETSDERAALQQVISPGAYVTPDGQVVQLGRAADRSEQSQEPDDGNVLYVSSQFLDKKTGDTLTVLQLRNVSLNKAFEGARVIGPNPLTSDKYKEMNAFQLRDPVPMKAVGFHDKGFDYVLVSTCLDYSQLQQIAERM